MEMNNHPEVGDRLGNNLSICSINKSTKRCGIVYSNKGHLALWHVSWSTVNLLKLLYKLGLNKHVFEWI